MSGQYLGFILQATYRVHHGVPVVYLFGRLQDGRTFLVKDNRQRPHFYVAADDAGRVRGATRIEPTERVSMDGRGLARVEVRVPQDAPGVRDALHGIGVATFEADVRFAMRYLIDRDIRGGVEITGSAQPGEGVALVFENPELRPAVVDVQPRVLSFDIETNPHTDALLAIAMYSRAPGGGEGDVLDEVVVVDPAGRTMPERAIGVVSEKAALAHFVTRVRELDPDVLTGWNVIDFDLAQLQGFAKRARLGLALGRERGELRIRPAEGYFGSGSASIPGRLVLDGMDLLRGAFVRMDEYSLDGVASAVLGEGKTLHGSGLDKVAQILGTYRDDLAAFAHYARTDARLALEIVEELSLIELSFARSALAGMPPDRVAASIASFDFCYLSALHKRGIAAPSVAQPGAGRVAQGGGAVFEPVVGLHQNVWVCDFKSLYPSIIRTFNIDPLGYIAAQRAGAEVVRTYDDTAFARDAGILPAMLDELFPRRAAAKAEGDGIASQAIKILMNSFYGVLGTPACRFYNPHIANAITSQGRHLLSWSKAWFEAKGYAVLYGDTDSVFVASGIAEPEAAAAQAEVEVAAFNLALSAYLEETSGVESRLELEFEKLYTQLFLAATRGGGQGARKRYAGKRLGEDEVEFVGLEAVRRDWTELAKSVQKNLISRLFAGEEVAMYLRGVVESLRAGELDDALVYRRGLRKKVSSYTTNIPPHVQAVKKSKRPPPRVVRYVVTTAGPELADEMSGLPDREHYLERQVRPVAEPVLAALGLNFEQVIGDDRQISLF